MKTLSCPLMVFAATGFVLSVLVHAMALLHIAPPFGKFVFALHLGIFVICLPTAFISQKANAEFSQRDLLKKVLRSCPSWIRYVLFGCGYYAIINFVILVLSSPPKTLPADSPIFLRNFSSGWIAFYAMAFAELYSYRHTPTQGIRS